MPIVLATTSSFATHSQELITTLESNGLKVFTNPFCRKLTENELIQLLEQHRPIGLLAGTEPVTAKALTLATPDLKVVSRVGVGWDNVNHDAAKDLHISVYRTEGVLDHSVAELTLGFILSALRHIQRHNTDVHNGHWKKNMGRLLYGKTVGIIGFGAIGQRVGTYVSTLGAKTNYCDMNTVSCTWGEQLCMEELLSSSDIISIHASGDCCVLGKQELDQCKTGAIIINTARGGQIDESALAERLQDGRIGYACLDVFEKEPYKGPLADLDNAILTPHIGSYALEARMEMEKKAVENLLHGLETLTTAG